MRKHLAFNNGIIVLMLDDTQFVCLYHYVPLPLPAGSPAVDPALDAGSIMNL